MRTRLLFTILLAAGVALASGCTNKQGESESPVFITVDLPLQPLIIDVNNPVPLQIKTITLRSRLKNPSSADPQGFADTEISFYTVEYFRRDAGTIVPPAEQFAAAVLVPSGGTATLSNFPIMSASAIQQSPFDQLLPFNGGIDRETGLNEIHMFYRLTFFGDTVSGHRVQSETATGDFFVQ
jgi:hypothetical protein